MSDLMMLGSVSRNETAFISDVMLLLPQDDGENKKVLFHPVFNRSFVNPEWFNERK